jgi:hypothetical protein
MNKKINLENLPFTKHFNMKKYPITTQMQNIVIKEMVFTQIIPLKKIIPEDEFIQWIEKNIDACLVCMTTSDIDFLIDELKKYRQLDLNISPERVFFLIHTKMAYYDKKY